MDATNNDHVNELLWLWHGWSLYTPKRHPKLNLDQRPETLDLHLGGRHAFADFSGSKFSHSKINMGVPQGGDLSPILFNIYLTLLPDPSSNVLMMSYADGCTVFALGVNIDHISARITAIIVEFSGIGNFDYLLPNHLFLPSLRGRKKWLNVD